MIQECAIDDFAVLIEDRAAASPESANYRFVPPPRPDEEMMAREEECDADDLAEQRRDDLTRVLRYLVGKRDDRPALICRRVFVLCAQFAPGWLNGTRWGDNAREVE